MNAKHIYGVLAFVVILAMIATPVYSSLTMRNGEPPFEGSHDETQVYNGGESVGLKNTVDYTEITDDSATSVTEYGGNVYYTSDGYLVKAIPPTGDSVTWTTQYQDIGLDGIYHVLTLDDDLLVATDRSVYSVDGGNANKIGGTSEDIINLCEFGNNFLAVCEEKLYKGNPDTNDWEVYEDLRNPEGALAFGVDSIYNTDGTEPKLDVYPYQVELDDEVVQMVFPAAVHEYIQDDDVMDLGRADFVERFGSYLNAYLNYYTQWINGEDMFDTENDLYDFFLNKVVARSVAIVAYSMSMAITEGAYEVTDGTVTFGRIYVEDDDLLLDFRDFQPEKEWGGGTLVTNVAPYRLTSYTSNLFRAQDMSYYYAEDEQTALYTANEFHVLNEDETNLVMTRFYAEEGNRLRQLHYSYTTSGLIPNVQEHETTYTHNAPIHFIQDAQFYSYVLIDGEDRVAVANGIGEDYDFTSYDGLDGVNDLTSYELYEDEWVNYIASDSGVGYVTTQTYARSGIYTSPVETIEDGGYIMGVEMSWTELDPIGLDVGIHDYYVQVSRDGGRFWYSINNTGRVDWPYGNAQEHTSFQYRIVYDSDRFASDLITDINYTLELASDIQISDLIDDPALEDFDPDLYYTCGYDPYMDEQWVRPVDLKLDLEDCYFGNKTLSVFWDWGDPYAWGEADFVMPTCPDLPPQLEWYRYDTFYVSPDDGFQLNASQHFYTQSGIYTITVDVYEGEYDTQAEAISDNATNASISTEVQIFNQPPKLDSVTPWNIRGEIGDSFSLTFDATDADGEISEYHFGPYSSDTPTLTWTATSLIDLTDYAVYVVDDEGAQSIIDDSTRVSVQITETGGNKAPEVDYDYSPIQPTYLDTVRFDEDVTDDGTITNYTWDMGDGTTLHGPSVSHSFDVGKYYVTLTAEDDGGLSANKTYLIVVRIPSGDLVITEDTTIEDYAWTMSGDIIVQGGANLTLSNCRVTFSCTSHGQYGIEVYGGLLMYDSSITGGVYGMPQTTPGGIEYHMQKMYIKAYSRGTILLDSSVIQALNTDPTLNQYGLTMEAPAVLNSLEGVIDGSRSIGVYLGQYLSIVGVECRVIGSDLTISGSNEYRGIGISAPIGYHTIDIDGISIEYYEQMAIIDDSEVIMSDLYMKFGYDGIYFGGISDVDISDSETISVWGEVIETDDSTNITIEDSVIKGSGDDSTILYSHGDSVAYINRSTLQSATNGMVTEEEAYIQSIESTFKTLYQNFIGYGNSLIEIKNYVAIRAQLEGNAIPASGLWLVDNYTVARDSWVDTSDYHLMTYARSTSGTITHPTCVVAVNTDYGTKEKVISPYKRILVMFNWGVGEIPIETPADDIEESLGTSFNALLIIGVIWVLIALAYYFDWGSAKQRLYATIGAGVLTPIIYLWDGITLAYESGVWGTPIIVPLAIVAIGALAYYYWGYGKGREGLYWSAVGGSAIVSYLYLSGYEGLLFGVAVLVVGAGLGYYALQARLRESGLIAIVIVFIIAIGALAYLLLGWTPFMYLGEFLGDLNPFSDGFLGWLTG